jgi:hypothetical protein
MARNEINVSAASVSRGSLEKIQKNIIDEILSKLEDETEILRTLCTNTPPTSLFFLSPHA